MNDNKYQLLWLIILIITILWWGYGKADVYVPKDNDLDCLAQNIYFESRSESQADQIAVGQVVLNRVKSSKYPNNVCGVIRQGPTYNWTENFPVRHKCQFSWYCDGKSDKIRDISAWRHAKAIAGVLLSMPDMVPNVVEDATHYHAHYVKPHWASKLEKVTRIDGHIFYRVND
jgi:spore germination cell wall hydrolase CwlJ-like protein